MLTLGLSSTRAPAAWHNDTEARDAPHHPKTEQPMSIIGTWDTTVKSPVGDQAIVFEFSDQQTGVAQHAMGSFPLENVQTSGDTSTFEAAITSPMKLSLSCSVTVDGDDLTGSASAGAFGTFAITGHRRVV
jgi:hypothetical protein